MSEKERVIRVLNWGANNNDNLALSFAVNQILLLLTGSASGYGKLDKEFLMSFDKIESEEQPCLFEM